MKRFLFALIGLLLVAGPPARAEDPPTLTIYTYSSFTSEWGPAGPIAKAFEAECACKIAWVAVDDAGVLLSRLRLEGASSTADVVLGLDTNLMAEAAATGLFAPHRVDTAALKLPMPWTDATFVPFDYGYFAVIYDSQAIATPPDSLKALVEGDPAQQIVIQDPRTSTPGLGLLLWVRQVYGDEAPAAWARLKHRLLTVTPGWSEAYGLFLDGEAPMVLSYTTSPAYHVVAEGVDRYKAAAFAEGHYAQVEVAGMLAGSRQPELARRFLAFILTPGFQQAIPTGNWMYPVIDLGDALPPAFADLPVPAKTLLYPPEEVAANRAAWIDEWLEGMSR